MNASRLLLFLTICCWIAAVEAGAQVRVEAAFPNLTFTRPVDMQHAGDGTNRLYVVEQAGTIRVFDNSAAATSAEIFLDIRDRVRSEGNEEGLLGVAFHPNYESNGYFYVNYVASDPRRTKISRFTRNASNPNMADPSSELLLFEVEQPFSNHKAGQVQFGGDGYLYIPLGDGGSAGDPFGNGQNLTVLLGKMLRIDVDNPSGGKNYGIPADNPYVGNTNGWREEIWAYGFRNPFRFSFDRQTGWLWLSDAGQDAIEEINVVHRGGNYGWKIMEGSGCFDPVIRCDSMAEAMGLEIPIYDYTHRLGDVVIGGYVYRGSQIPDLVGKYIFADFSSGRVWALEPNPTDTSAREVREVMNLGAQQIMSTSFAEDQNREIYILAIDGKIHRLAGSVPAVQHPQARIGDPFPNLTFTRPVDMQHAGDGTNRLYVVEQAGTIRVFDNSAAATSADIFLDIRDRVRSVGNEEGLLGVAFHPNYESNGYFYVNYVASDPRRTKISRFTRSASNPNMADPSSELILMEVEQPFSNHKAGQVQFGGDGYLYIPLGDGGSAGDPFGNGQNLTVLLGKMLRIDVDNPGAVKNYGIPADNPYVGNTNGWREEIWAYGFRNPFRFSFDRQTGWLWLSDAGQDAIEEIDVVRRGGNYGWKIMEGSGCFEPKIRCDSMAEAMGLEIPIYDYTHRLGDVVIGGYVYRGSRIPELVGKYIFSDFVASKIWALEFNMTDTSAVDVHEIQGIAGENPLLVTSYAEDQNNEIYMLGIDGKIRSLASVTSSIADDGAASTGALAMTTWPNPFAGSTIISYDLPKRTRVELALFDLLGRRVRTLVDRTQEGGRHEVMWNGSAADGIDLPEGMYLCRLLIDNATAATTGVHLQR